MKMATWNIEKMTENNTNVDVQEKGCENESVVSGKFGQQLPV
jgi:hypothetical protein